MTNLLFLDIDGVLNSEAFYWRRPACGGAPLDPDAVARLNRVVAATGASVVLSSSWRGRTDAGRATVAAQLREVGFVGEIIGQTPWIDEPCDRSREIAHWLAEHATETDRFVVLDDDGDAWCEEFAGRGLMVRTSYRHGLVDAHVPLICGFLGADR